MGEKISKNRGLRCQGSIILASAMVLYVVIFSSLASSVWSNQDYLYRRNITGLQQFIPLPINGTNYATLNGVTTIIYSIGTIETFLYYNNELSNIVANDTAGFWRVQTEGFGITNKSAVSGTPPDNLTVFITLDNNATTEFVNNVNGTRYKNATINFSFGSNNYFGGAKLGTSTPDSGGYIDYAVSPFANPKGTAIIYFQAITNCIGGEYNEEYLAAVTGTSAYISNVGSEDKFVVKLGNAGRLINVACSGWWSAGNWVNLAVTWDTDTDNYAVYVNNVQKATSTTAESTPTSTGLRIGTTTQPIGNVTHIMFFNRVLNSSEINSTYSIQNINLSSQKSLFDNCTGNTEEIFNFTLKDEATKSVTAGNISIYLQLNQTGIAYNGTYVNVNETRVCVSEWALGSYKVYATINFESPLRIKEFYYFQNYSLTSSTKMNVSLYDLLLTDSTSFLFSFSDYNEDPVKDAIIKVWRKYIGGGNYEVVEISKTDENGESIVHLVEEDIIYFFEVWKEGILLFNSTEGIALCQAVPCTLTYRQEGGGFVSLPTEWTRVPDGSFVWSASRSLRIVNITFNYTSSHENNLTVYELNPNKSISDNVINSSFLNAANGILSVTVPTVFGNKTYYATYHRTGSGYAFISNRWLDFNIDPEIFFGDVGIFFVGLVVLLMFLLALASGVWSIIMAGVGLLVMSMLGFIKLGAWTLGFFAVAAVIIIIKLFDKN